MSPYERIHGLKYADPRPTATFDIECLRNYFSIGFLDVETLESVCIEMYEGKPLNRKKIASVLRRYRVVGANSKHYDNQMLALAMKEGVTNAELKRASDDIIQGGLKPWDFEEKFNVKLPEWYDEIDVWEVDPGSPQCQSLKIRGARVHCRTMQEMPISHDAWVGPEDIVTMGNYNKNDLLVTRDVYLELKAQIDLRAMMSDRYGIDLRSKSDAQMAEAIMHEVLRKILGKKRLYAPKIKYKSFFYEPPTHIKFQTPAMQAMLEDIRKTEFFVAENGTVLMPEALANRKILIGEGIYKMGLGGLHSSEQSISHFADELMAIIDRDVKSYYPSIILNNELFPPELGREFLRQYLKMYIERLHAKGMGWADIAETLKIVLNGLFGKTGSPFSIVYDPKTMVQITLTGQLDILMLIEELEIRTFQVISANTDGIVTKVPREKRGLFDCVIFDWEMTTKFETEETEYTAVHSRDVNCYAAIYIDPKTGKKKAKIKGNIGPCGPGLKGAAGLKKNPTMDISSRAALDFLINGTKIEEYINKADDIRHFLVVRKSSEFVWEGEELVGKALRWYYSTERHGVPLLAENISARKKNPEAAEFKQVSKSEGARTMLTLPDFDECPDDLDRAVYIREAYAILQDVGYGAYDPSLAGRSGLFLGIQGKQKTLHYVNAETGTALCDKTQKSIRDPWKEYGSAPVGLRICKTCREARGMEV